MTAVNQQPPWVQPLMAKLTAVETLLAQALPLLPQVQADGRASGQFDAIELVPALLDGKVYWSVRGGPYSKHGASIWPEVMKPAGFDPDTLDIRHKVDLKGWVAKYTCEPDGSKPKVVELVPPSSTGSGNGNGRVRQTAVQSPPPEPATQPAPADAVAEPSGNGRHFPVEPDWAGIVLRCETADAFDGSVVRWLDYFSDAGTVGKARETLWGGFEDTAVAGYAAGLEAYVNEVRRQVDAGEPNSGKKAMGAARRAYNKALKIS